MKYEVGSVISDFLTSDFRLRILRRANLKEFFSSSLFFFYSEPAVKKPARIRLYLINKPYLFVETKAPAYEKSSSLFIDRDRCVGDPGRLLCCFYCIKRYP